MVNWESFWGGMVLLWVRSVVAEEVEPLVLYLHPHGL